VKYQQTVSLRSKNDCSDGWVAARGKPLDTYDWMSQSKCVYRRKATLISFTGRANKLVFVVLRVVVEQNAV